MIQALLIDLDSVIRIWDGSDARAAEERFALLPGTIPRTAFSPDLVTQAITGAITDEEWRRQVAQRLRAQLTDVDADEAVRIWSASSGRVDAEALALVRGCRQRAKIALVTNATSRLPADLALLGIAGEFDAIINSSDIGCAKPAPQIYETALQAAGVSPGEALFVDDRPENVAAATAIGMAGHPYVDVEALQFELKRHKLI